MMMYYIHSKTRDGIAVSISARMDNGAMRSCHVEWECPTCGLVHISVGPEGTPVIKCPVCGIPLNMERDGLTQPWIGREKFSWEVPNA